MALTNYLAQSLVMTGLFYGLGLYGRTSSAFAAVAMAAVWALELLWSRPWLARFRFGPAEWLRRRLTCDRRIARARDARQGERPHVRGGVKPVI